MKKKALVSSILVIALCLSLIVGSTYALFTDSTEFNIAVTSGDVEIESYATVVETYSAQGPVEAHSDKYLKDEHGAYYEHIAPKEGGFTNGGDAVVDQKTGILNITDITPGDRVDVQINTKNTSTVALRYRYTISVLIDGGLATGMVFTDYKGEGEKTEYVYEGVKSFTSEWYPVVAPGAEIPAQIFSLELPVYAGNEYQSEKIDQPEDGRKAGAKTVQYQILVEAVQGNAVTTENETFVTLYPTQSALELVFEKGGEVSLDGEKLPLEGALLATNKAITLANGTFDGTNIPTYTEEGMTSFVICNADDKAGTFNASITLKDGAELIAPQKGVGDPDKHAIFLFEGKHEVRIEKGAKIVASNGDYNSCIQVCYATASIYIEDVSSLVYDETTGACGILVTAATSVTIYAPNQEVADQIEALKNDPNSGFIKGDGTVVTVKVAQ